MAEMPNPDEDAAAMRDAFQRQDFDVDAETTARGRAVADAQAAADELLRSRTENLT
ncbi:MAG TPA: hypothetical protein VII76_05650 [Acidimicrobiales bacterium]